jgi:[acyl-carrier-protein] S-malonyltransferase
MIDETQTKVGAAIDAALPVFMCSGQGSQKPGMGADLFDVPEVAAAFDTAGAVFGCDMRALVSGGDAAALNETRNAQAAIVTLSLGIARALEARGVRPGAVLGFSLGQITALALAGMVSDEQMFDIVAHRAAYMGQAAEATDGCMSAFLKADEAALAPVVEAAAQGEVLVMANFNCPGQIVVSGATGAVERAEAAWTAAGKRCARLATQGAFHSPLMAPAAEAFADYLQGVEFSEPAVPLISNTTARPLHAADARDQLVAHLTHGVRFEQSVNYLVGQGARAFVETGFGGVLSGLVRRIDKSLERACVQDAKSFAAYVEKEGN